VSRWNATRAAEPPTPAPDPLEAAREQVRAAEVAFAGSVAAKDRARFESMIADDAVFIGGGELRGRADIVAGLTMTRHFLLHHLLAPHGGKLPEARERFAERMRRGAVPGIIHG